MTIISNSITDGKCPTTNGQDRWPDILSETLQDRYNVKDLGILNLGIGNNRVALPGGFGYMPGNVSIMIFWDRVIYRL